MDITQINSKLTSRRMRSATLGSHVPRVRPAHMNADQVGFSSPRRQKRAQRGYVSNVMPAPRAREAVPVMPEGSSSRRGSSAARSRSAWASLWRWLPWLAAAAYGVGSFTLMGNLNRQAGAQGFRCRQGSLLL